MPLPNKRYICSIVRRVDGVYKADVVVVAEKSVPAARALVCDKYSIPNVQAPYNYVSSVYTGEGIRSIRVAETNTYDTENPEFDNFRDDS